MTVVSLHHKYCISKGEGKSVQRCSSSGILLTLIDRTLSHMVLRLRRVSTLIFLVQSSHSLTWTQKSSGLVPRRSRMQKSSSEVAQRPINLRKVSFSYSSNAPTFKLCSRIPSWLKQQPFYFQSRFHASPSFWL